MSTIIITNLPGLIEALDEFVDLDYSGEEYDNYWCIQIKPFKCGGCGNVVAYAQCGNHFIVIWENKDDQSILDTAAELQKEGNIYDPYIVQYNRILGPCVKYEDAVEHGWIEELTH